MSRGTLKIFKIINTMVFFNKKNALAPLGMPNRETLKAGECGVEIKSTTGKDNSTKCNKIAKTFDGPLVGLIIVTPTPDRKIVG